MSTLFFNVKGHNNPAGLISSLQKKFKQANITLDGQKIKLALSKEMSASEKANIADRVGSLVKNSIRIQEHFRSHLHL